MNKEILEEFTKKWQTDFENIAREYCQHLFLSYLYQLSGSERLLFKGGTALRIVLRSPRFSEDLDFIGSGIRQNEIEELFAGALEQIEKTGMLVELLEGKNTAGGYLGIAVFEIYGYKIKIQIEVSLRQGKRVKGLRSLIQSDYLSAYTLVSLPIDNIIDGKMAALRNRHKPRDFYDYFFLLSGNYPSVKNKENLIEVLELLKNSRINFKTELKKFLPKNQATLLKDFKKILEQKILSYLGKEYK